MVEAEELVPYVQRVSDTVQLLVVIIIIISLVAFLLSFCTKLFIFFPLHKILLVGLYAVNKWRPKPCLDGPWWDLVSLGLQKHAFTSITKVELLDEIWILDGSHSDFQVRFQTWTQNVNRLMVSIINRMFFCDSRESGPFLVRDIHCCLVDESSLSLLFFTEKHNKTSSLHDSVFRWL